jgi:hypothetical protein
MPLPFVGPSYQLANRKASQQRSVNLYLVGMETPSKAPFILQSVPGLTLFSALGSPIRGMCEAAGRLFVVAGSTLYELTSAGVATALGTVSPSTGPVDFAQGQTQLVVVTGPNGYILTLATNAFTQITAAGWLGSNRVAYLDGYFIFVQPGTQQFYYSKIDDAGTIGALDTFLAQSNPDKIVAQLVDHREIWLIGEKSTEVWFVAGGDVVFARNNGALLEVGCIASFSAVKVDNGLMWIGRDANGSGIVYKTGGYQVKRVSTIAVEEALQGSTDLTSATAFVYQQNGQTFYCVNAPGLASTWCYEVSTDSWHERCDLDGLGQFTQHRSSTHAFAFNQHLVGDSAGNVYTMSPTAYTFNGTPIKRSRISPDNVSPARDRIYYAEFILDCSTGVAASGTPSADLSYSDNGGFTYGTPISRTVGALGNYAPRLQWTRLGQARDRVWRVDFSADAPFSIIDGQAR